MKHLLLFEYFHYADIKRVPNGTKLYNLMKGMPVKWKERGINYKGYFYEYSEAAYKVHRTENINGINQILIDYIPYTNITFNLDKSQIERKKSNRLLNFIKNL